MLTCQWGVQVTVDYERALGFNHSHNTEVRAVAGLKARKARGEVGLSGAEVCCVMYQVNWDSWITAGQGKNGHKESD